MLVKDLTNGGLPSVIVCILCRVLQTQPDGSSISPWPVLAGHAPLTSPQPSGSDCTDQRVFSIC